MLEALVGVDPMIESFSFFVFQVMIPFGLSSSGAVGQLRATGARFRLVVLVCK
jgi:hypothetical protein